MVTLVVIVGKGKLCMDPSKIQDVLNWPIPKNPTDVWSFLGFIGFYRYFIPKYSEITQPLLDLTKKLINFEWGPQQHQAFRELQQRICSSPVLIQPNFNRQFYLQADTSLYSIGAILSQEGDHLSQSLAK